MPIVWTPELDTGIAVIDQQHMKIVDYINALESAHALGLRTTVGQTLDELVEYTMSHFAFEESLQEEAGYPFCKPHRKVHELFIRRINEYVERFNAGEDITSELHKLLSAWLINHIRRDDADYVAAVKSKMIGLIEEKEKKKSGWLSRFFR